MQLINGMIQVPQKVLREAAGIIVEDRKIVKVAERYTKLHSKLYWAYFVHIEEERITGEDIVFLMEYAENALFINTEKNTVQLANFTLA